MDQEVMIQVDHVSKHFKVFLDKSRSLSEKVLFKNRRRSEDRKVLKDISFQVKRGEAIGLVGENGCGKSTMLKMLSRIMYPDTGAIEIKGRVSALIELGAGFHPDLSGRENIYTNAAIFGLTRTEIDARLQNIIDFSELGDYVDNPVRTYSSGMYMRLAFSVAINVDADVLLIDEILGVGDVAFQAKCFNKLREIKRKGCTIVIVSHSLGQIEQICDRSIWIENGLIREEGRPMDVHQKYLQYMSTRNETMSQHDRQDETEEEKAAVPEQEKEETAPEQKTEETTPEQAEPEKKEEKEPEDDGKRWGSRDITFEEIRLLDETGAETKTLQSGKPFSITMKYRIDRPIEEVSFGIGIFRNDGLQCYGTNTHIDRIIPEMKDKTGTVTFEVKENGLLEGGYLLDAAIHKPDGFPYDYYRECLTFSVTSVIRDAGVTRLNHEWHFE